MLVPKKYNCIKLTVKLRKKMCLVISWSCLKKNLSFVQSNTKVSAIAFIKPHHKNKDIGVCIYSLIILTKHSHY